MKHFNELLFISAIAAVPLTSQAELKALDDGAMSNMTGQSGISIDLTAKVEIGEVAYKDEGFRTAQGIRFGGANTTGAGTSGYLDNLTMTVDVAGAGESFNYGFSHLQEMNDKVQTNGGSNTTSWQSAADSAHSKQTHGDGDLVIRLNATDFGVSDSELLNDDFSTSMTKISSAVDFGLEVDEVRLHKSDYEVGSYNGGTVVRSGTKIKGYMGPIDIIIRNSSGTTSSLDFGYSEEYQISNGSMDINAYLVISDLETKSEVTGVKVSGVKVHNNRGDLNGADGKNSFGFAHVQAKVAEASGNGHNGLVLYNVNVAADIDVPDITFGTSPSIGGIYITDVSITNASLLVYGH